MRILPACLRMRWQALLFGVLLRLSDPWIGSCTILPPLSSTLTDALSYSSSLNCCGARDRAAETRERHVSALVRGSRAVVFCLCGCLARADHHGGAGLSRAASWSDQRSLSANRIGMSNCAVAVSSRLSCVCGTAETIRVSVVSARANCASVLRRHSLSSLRCLGSRGRCGEARRGV